MSPVTRIVSGGQTGADQGALCAGYLLGIPTGGWAPRGWRTEDGPEPALAAFGLVEAASSDYAVRTHLNVRDSDGTLIFGKVHSQGSRLTGELCEREGRPCLRVAWWPDIRPALVEGWTKTARAWLADARIGVLNVAGNRESVNPGIGAATCAFLQSVLACS